MAEAREILDELVETMPSSLERVQVGTARKALARAQSTCAATIKAGQKAMGHRR